MRQIEDVLGIQPKERKQLLENTNEVQITQQVDMNSAFVSQEETSLEEMRQKVADLK
jgi:hypothetical protein